MLMNTRPAELAKLVARLPEDTLVTVNGVHRVVVNGRLLGSSGRVCGLSGPAQVQVMPDEDRAHNCAYIRVRSGARTADHLRGVRTRARTPGHGYLGTSGELMVYLGRVGVLDPNGPAWHALTGHVYVRIGWVDVDQLDPWSPAALTDLARRQLWDTGLQVDGPVLRVVGDRRTVICALVNLRRGVDLGEVIHGCTALDVPANLDGGLQVTGGRSLLAWSPAGAPRRRCTVAVLPVDP